MPQTRNPMFWSRAGTTLIVLGIYCLGTNVPLPGLDPEKVSTVLGSSGPAAIDRLSILSLGVMPLLNALILIEIVKLIAPGLRTWELATPGNRQRMDYVVIGLTLFMALLQAAGLASGLEEVSGLVSEPGTAFRAICVATLLGSTALVIAFVTLIDRAGLGSGLWLLFLTPALAALPRTLAQLAVLHERGEYSSNAILLGIAFTALAIAAIASIVLAARAAPATVATCIWTPIIANTGVTLLLLIDLWLVTQSADASAALTSPGTLFWSIALVPAVALVAWIYVRTVRPGGQPSPIPAAPIAASIAAILVAGSMLERQFGVVLPLNATQLIILAAVATTILVEWGFIPTPSDPAASEEISPQA
jgi:preprotein translocase subunit SecY